MQFFVVFYLVTGISLGMPITDQVQQWMSSKVELMTEALESLSSLLSESIQLRAEMDEIKYEDQQDYAEKLLDEIDRELEKYDY